MQDFCLRTFNRECLPLASIFDMGSAESSTDHDNAVLSSAVMSEVHHQRQLQQQQQQQNNQVGSAVSNWKNSLIKQKQSSKSQEDNDDKSKSTYSSKFFSSNGVLTNTAKYYLHYRNATLQGLLDMRHISLAEMTDRIAHSTPRLLAFCNLILAVTYMLHCSVADFFLAGQSHVILENGRRTLSSSSVYLETLASYFFFKLLLVSAIVEPDALDAFILLIWYSIHSFLRSLLIQAHQTVTGSIHRGTRIPSKAIVLLGILGVWNVCSGVVCYMLFREAGMHMVTILLAECVLLGVDLISNGIIIVQEFCEERDQLETTNLPNISTLNELKTLVSVLKPLLNLSHYLHLWYMHFRIGIVGCIVLGKCHSYARKILREISNHKKKNMLNNQLHTLFPDADVCELKPDNVCCICLTALSSGTGVKRVKCGHLYHANCLRQVVERARSIEAARCPMCRCTMLENATQSSFSSSTEPTAENAANINVNNNVNAPVAQHIEGENGALGMAAPANATNNQHQQQQQQQVDPVVADLPVFRFSTDGIFPAWIPIPAFSFEIVRRPNPNVAPALRAGTIMDIGGNNNNTIQQQQGNGLQLDDNDDEAGLFDRIFNMFAASPMTAEQERAALNHLSDMFPQYSRDNLLSELQRLGSVEAVVESIFLGRFTDRGRDINNVGNRENGGNREELNRDERREAMRRLPRDTIMFT